MGLTYSLALLLLLVIDAVDLIDSHLYAILLASDSEFVFHHTGWWDVDTSSTPLLQFLLRDEWVVDLGYVQSLKCQLCLKDTNDEHLLTGAIACYL